MCPSGLPSSKWQISALGFFALLPGQSSDAGHRPPTRITPAVVLGVAVITMIVIAAAKEASPVSVSTTDFRTVASSFVGVGTRTALTVRRLRPDDGIVTRVTGRIHRPAT